MHELLASHQFADVKEYHVCFEDIRHKLLVRNLSLDENFLVSKFLDGLKLDIKSGIVLHKPRTIDVAFSLGLM
jgi:hypothetical protein